MEKALYTAIKTQAQTELPEIKFIAMWNNQLEETIDGKTYSFQMPALFVEFPDNTPCDVVGNGVRVFDPLQLVFHLIDNRLDNMDGTMEENFEVFTLKQKLRLKFQQFKCTGSGSFNCTSETTDKNHTNLYHFMQEYTTTWTDNGTNLPIGGYEDLPPFTTVITPAVENLGS